MFGTNRTVAVNNSYVEESVTILRAGAPVMLIFSFLGFAFNRISLEAIRMVRPTTKPYHLLLLNLCLADMFVFFCLFWMSVPLIVYAYSGDGEIIARMYAMDSSITRCQVAVDNAIGLIPLLASALTILVIVLNLYIAIRHPFRYNTLVTKKRAVIVNILVWVVAFLLGGLNIFVALGNLLLTSPKDATYAKFCLLLWKTDAQGYYLILPILIGLEVVILACMKLRVFLTAKKKMCEPPAAQLHTLSQSCRFKLAKLVITLFGSLICCWLPFVLSNFIYNIIEPISAIRLQYLSFFLLLFNSILNPFVYGLSLAEVREAHRCLFKDAFKNMLKQEPFTISITAGEEQNT